MSVEKSTDPGLSAAERKELRGREAKGAMADKMLKRRFRKTMNLRSDRLTREAVAGPMLYPAPELPDTRPSTTFDFLQESGTQ